MNDTILAKAISLYTRVCAEETFTCMHAVVLSQPQQKNVSLQNPATIQRRRRRFFRTNIIQAEQLAIMTMNIFTRNTVNYSINVLFAQILLISLSVYIFSLFLILREHRLPRWHTSRIS